MEPLDRGLAAMRTAGGIFLSWRLLCTEDPRFGTAEGPVVFTVRRDGSEIARLTGKTCFTDRQGTMDSVYSVWDSRGGKSREVRAFRSGSNWFDIPLDRPAPGIGGPYTINDVSAGDLDGDGVYELVVKWDSGGLDNAADGRTGNVLLDAYRLDGTRLWKQPVDLGVNIRAGAHYTQFLVYDLDRDGKSEVILKTAPGSRDAEGQYVSRVSRESMIRETDDTADHRNEKGHVTQGEEFLTVFRGDTGQAADTIWYPNQRIDARIWGDDRGNRSERYTAAVAWLDGKKPYAFFMRGYYWGKTHPLCARQCACAVAFDGTRLSCRHSFDTYDERTYAEREHSDSFTPDGRYKGVRGYRWGNRRYIGEGNHNCIVADVDGDGRDEVLTGALCYELDRRNRLRVKWCSFLGHGDAMHIRARAPEEGGYELFTVQENGGLHPVTQMELTHGMTVLDAADGRILFHCDSPDDAGRGMMADVGAGGQYQIWGVWEDADTGKRGMIPPQRRTETGFEEISIPGATTNFRIFWDGDLYDELLDGDEDAPLEIRSWDGGKMTGIFRTEGCVSINGTKANPCLQADLLGDWREELVMAREDSEALRVFVSDIPTDFAMMTLMHDPVYRAGAAAEQTAYNQPPHPGFYLAPECFDGETGPGRNAGRTEGSEA